MLKSPLLFAVSVLVTLIHWTGIAKAQDLNVGLNFDLPPVQTQAIVPAEPSVQPSIEAPAQPTRIEIASAPQPVVPDTLDLAPVVLAPSDIALPSHTTSELASPTEAPPPLTIHEASDASSNVEEQADTNNIALTFASNTLSIDSLAITENSAPALLSSTSETVAISTDRPLSFPDNALGLDDWIFEHGTHSLVAHTVGSAEGTRRADGQRTAAYYGHTDPGNGVWNLGTFSYQHEASSPEDADEKQLQRLKRQGLELEAQAAQNGLALSLEEKLNGLDLANQAPLAALDKGGYIERLAQAKRLQMEGDEAILWARTHAYIDPNTRRWNAPGLGNNVHSISEDQSRRISAIASALKAYNPRGMDTASLAHLQQISLADSGTQTSPSLVEGVDENDRTLYTESQLFAEPSDFEISFGLPPASPSNDVESSTFIATLEPPLVVETAIADTKIENTRETEPTGIAETPQTRPDIGVAFSPTGNIADTVVVASPITQPGELSSTEIETAEAETTDVEAIETETTEVVTPETEAIATEIDEVKVAEPEAVEPQTVEQQTTDTSDLFTLESLRNTADSEQLDATAADREDRLQSLRAGIRETADPEALEALKHREAEPAANRLFFRTEDKIVQEK